MEFFNHHKPREWKYEGHGLHYLRIGAYDGIDDLEYVIHKNGSVYLPEVRRTYSDVQKAYKEENRKWIQREEFQDLQDLSVL